MKLFSVLTMVLATMLFVNEAGACVSAGIGTTRAEKDSYIKGTAFTGIFVVTDVQNLKDHSDILESIKPKDGHLPRPVGWHFYRAKVLRTYNGNLEEGSIIFQPRSIDCSTIPLVEKGKTYRRILFKDKNGFYDDGNLRLSDEDWNDLALEVENKTLKAQSKVCDEGQSPVFKNDELVCIGK
jgi:hypothetical protein